MSVFNSQNAPMLATYSRMLAAIPIIILYYMGGTWAEWPIVVVFMVASWTDWLDGYLARKFQTESDMGKFMDPIADKLLVLTCLILLVHARKLDPILVVLLVGRDIYIGGIRAVAAKENVVIAAKAFGKWKTALQMFSIPCLFIFKPELFFNLPIDLIGVYGLWVSVVLSGFSGIQYTMGYYKGSRSFTQ
ncbi:MAG: CDP-diacylglycerol--glycerol-3-phosphate 3-phosphatidyltransferase [Bdellovibrionales bacterium]